MSDYDRLLQAKKEAEEHIKDFGEPPRPAERTVREARVLPPAEKDGACHCGYDQTCAKLVCDACGRMRPHNAVVVITRSEEGFMTDFFYRHCRCGAKQWMYPCEKGMVVKTL